MPLPTRTNIWIFLITASFATSASAQGPRSEADGRGVGAGDATYGRIDGDLGFDVGGGIAFGPRTPHVDGTLRLRYVDTIGLFIGYEEGRLLSTRADPDRLMATGLELRPLFLMRWLKGWESGRAFTDLTIDSIGLELGAVLQKPAGEAFGTRPGFEAGLGIEVPLSRSATGAFVGVHAGVRWSEAALSGEPLLTPSDRALYLAVTLEWHQIFGAHIVDFRDRAPTSGGSRVGAE